MISHGAPTQPACLLDASRDMNLYRCYNVEKAKGDYGFRDYVSDPPCALISVQPLKKYLFQKRRPASVISAEDVKRNGGLKMDELLVQTLKKIEE